MRRPAVMLSEAKHLNHAEFAVVEILRANVRREGSAALERRAELRPGQAGAQNDKRSSRFCAFAAVLLAVLFLPGTAHTQKGPRFPATAIQIQFVRAADVTLPPEFQVALYEYMVEEVKKTGKFQRVYRDGEKGAEGEKELMTLRSLVTGFSEGSARARQVTTVAGATKIKVRVQVSTRDDRMIIDRDVDGNVRFFGENLRATYNFAKGVAKLIKQNF